MCLLCLSNADLEKCFTVSVTQSTSRWFLGKARQDSSPVEVQGHCWASWSVPRTFSCLRVWLTALSATVCSDHWAEGHTGSPQAPNCVTGTSFQASPDPELSRSTCHTSSSSLCLGLDSCFNSHHILRVQAILQSSLRFGLAWLLSLTTCQMLSARILHQKVLFCYYRVVGKIMVYFCCFCCKNVSQLFRQPNSKVSVDHA